MEGFPNRYATRDLFIPHPDEDGLWRLVARKDDVITLGIGEKIVPIQQEGRISASPLISGAVMFGRGRPHPGVLIELHPSCYEIRDDMNQPSSAKSRSLLDDIWSDVDAANGKSPPYAKIAREMILFAHPEKPLPRAGKGTVIRNQALTLYAAEIDELYTTSRIVDFTDEITLPTSWTPQDVQSWLLEHARTVLGKDEVTSQVSLFDQGLDSLGVTFMRNRINGALRALRDNAATIRQSHIPSSFVYDYPSVEKLTDTLMKHTGSSLDNVGETPSHPTDIDIKNIHSVIKEHCMNMSIISTPTHTMSTTYPVVLITGVTGNIGSHILASLLANDRVGRVLAIIRSQSEDTKHRRLEDVFIEKRLPLQLLSDPRLEILEGDLAAPSMGLGESTWNEIMRTITHIVHNAWTVNFNLPLQAFEDDFRGLQHIFELCVSAGRPIQLLHASSVSVTTNREFSQGLIPESILGSHESAYSNGYMASKYIAENMVSKFIDSGGQAAIVRIGQACGPCATGAWSTREWFPAVIKSGITMGALPMLSERIDWIPLDVIGDIYCEWIASAAVLPSLVNMIHPRPTSWTTLSKGVTTGLGRALPNIPFDQWVHQLSERSINATKDGLRDLPASLIMDTLKSLTTAFEHIDSASSAHSPNKSRTQRYETTNFEKSSSIAQHLKPLNEEYGAAWVTYWKETGYLT